MDLKLGEPWHVNHMFLFSTDLNGDAGLQRSRWFGWPFLGYSFFLAPGKGPEAQAADQAWGTASQSRECCQQSADAAFGIRSTVPHDVHHWLMVTAQLSDILRTQCWWTFPPAKFTTHESPLHQIRISISLHLRPIGWPWLIMVVV